MSRSIPVSSALALGAALLLSACGSSGSSPSTAKTTAKTAAATTTPASPSATVKTASSSLGTILVDANGMTLYRLSGESAGHFICTPQSCLAVWHPLRPSGAQAPSGTASLATVKRPDGSLQVTYQGAPLYTFASDRSPGETNGEGLKDVGTWSVVKLAGSSAAPGAPASSQETGGSGSGESGGAYKY